MIVKEDKAIFVQGDILDSPLDRVICIQVNVQGVVKGGINEIINNRFPGNYEVYREFCAQPNMSYEATMGNCLSIETTDILTNKDRKICNLFAQYHFYHANADLGNNVGIRFTDYEMFTRALYTACAHSPNEILAVPYGIGCNESGGNWDIIYSILSSAPNTVEIYHKDLII